MWQVCTSSLDKSIHVVPLEDLREHEASCKCWCCPVEDDKETGVMTHCSMDGREAFERGERLPS